MGDFARAMTAHFQVMSMSPESQNVVPFDPEESTLPDSLQWPVDGGGEVVVVLADAATRESGWGPRAAVALARAWAGAGHRVYLMDGDVAEPRIHTLLDENNGEGVTDAVLYGVSPTRMARMRDEGFAFASAGTAVADPAGVLRHPRWSSVLSACRESESLVVLYLPAGASGVDHLAGEGDRVVRLKTALSATATPSEPGTWVLHPPRSVKEDAQEGASPSEEGAKGREAGAAVPASSAAAAFASATPDAPSGETRAEPATAASTTPAAEAPDTKGGLKPRPVKRRTSPWILLLLILLVGGVLAALWLGLIQIPGLTPTPAAADVLDLSVRSP
jgi:hypothetical protein